MKIRNISFVFLVIFVLSACSPAAKVLPTETVTQKPTSTSTLLPSAIPSIQPLATPTAFQLPWNEIPNDTTGYCLLAPTQLVASDTQGLSEDEIAMKLIDLWLAYFNAPQAPGDCHVDGYHVDEVYYDERTPYLPLEPKGDFMRVVRFSVKLVQIPNSWMTWAGEIDQQNWLHTGANLAIFRLEDGYTMKFAYP
jgi:hypothetical protein